MLLFWICSAALTVAVVVALTRPLAARRTVAADGEPTELALYREQLDEIEADKSSGLLSAEEAEAARAEIGRRLIAAADRVVPGRSGRAASSERLFYAVAAAIPAIALALYVNLGSPNLPGQAGGSQRPEPGAPSEIEQMILQVEARLKENPGDGIGWDVIAPVYLRLERHSDAAAAFQRAMTLLGPTTKRLAGFADATVMANNGIVTEPARKAYQKILELEPGRPEARFGLALAKEQDGDPTSAEADYKSLLVDTAPDLPWRAYVAERLDAIAAQRGGEKGPAASPEAAQAIANLPPAERMAVIQQMVDGLEARLKSNGNDPDGWQRLLRSLSVLGNKERATTALIAARKALAADAKGLADINALAKSLGLGG